MPDWDDKHRLDDLNDIFREAVQELREDMLRGHGPVTFRAMGGVRISDDDYLVGRLEAERDSWRRRAEAAEAGMREQRVMIDDLMTALKLGHGGGEDWVRPIWKRVLALVHPDRHGDSIEAKEITQMIVSRYRPPKPRS